MSIPVNPGPDIPSPIPPVPPIGQPDPSPDEPVPDPVPNDKPEPNPDLPRISKQLNFPSYRAHPLKECRNSHGTFLLS
jgi:hypothetical protein